MNPQEKTAESQAVQSKSSRVHLRGLFLLIVALDISFSLFCARESERNWLSILVPVLPRPFTDMRIMLEGAEIVRHQGITGFWESVNFEKLDYNYPRAWAALGFIGFGVDALYLCATVALVSWIFSTRIIFGEMDLRIRRTYKSIVLVLLFLSPAVLLSFERANTDLLIYGGVVLIMGTNWLKGRFHHRWLLLFFFLLLVTLKFYPVLLFPAIWLMVQQSKTDRVLLLLGTFSCLLFLAPDLIEVAARTHQGGPASYGVTVFKLYLAEGKNNYAKVLLGTDVDFALLSRIVGGASYTVALSALIFSPWIAQYQRTLFGNISEAVNIDNVVDRLWLAGSLIYTGTFLLGANFDYRLAFLLLTAPWYFNQPGKLPVIHLTLMLVSMWAWYLPRDFLPFRLLAYLAQWLLYIETVTLLFVRCFRPFWRNRAPVVDFSFR